MESPTSLSTAVIIPTRNRLKEIVRFVDSLAIQSLVPDEFIVVDSSDIALNEEKNFLECLKKLSQKTTFKYFRSLPSATLQRNIGVKNTNADLLFFFDDDIVLDKDFLAQMHQAFI